MAINKFMQAALKAISYSEGSVISNYPIERGLKSLSSKSLLEPLYKLWDRNICVDGREIPVRIYKPREPHDLDQNGLCDNTLIFFHGGGWVKETVDTYNDVCRNMAKYTGSVVVSVNYRLAPENKFPDGLEDCYAAAKELFLHPDTLGIFSDNYTLIGDSAGGNLAAAVSLLARDRGEFEVKRQILIYPATQYDHSPDCPFDSVRENGTDYLLTAKRINEYIQLYRRSEADMRSPYFSPLLADLKNQPDTLVISAEFDPLRDEGEAYAKKLLDSGNRAYLYRMKDGLHGFLSLPPRFIHVRRAYTVINAFLNKELLNDGKTL